MTMITVQPARHLRQAFARWATAQQPKLRTVSESAFAVPSRLFAAIPAELLEGALVDGVPIVTFTAGSVTLNAETSQPPISTTLEPATGSHVTVPLTPVGAERFSALLDKVQHLPEGPPPESVLLEGRQAVPGKPPPELPESAYPPGAVPLDPAERTAPAAPEQPPHAAPEAGEVPCGRCSRSFHSERAASAHRRQAHAETKG